MVERIRRDYRYKYLEFLYTRYIVYPWAHFFCEIVMKTYPARLLLRRLRGVSWLRIEDCCIYVYDYNPS